MKTSYKISCGVSFLVALITIFFSLTAEVAGKSFDFESLNSGDNIGEYMTGIYGSPIEVTGAAVTVNTLLPYSEGDKLIWVEAAGTAPQMAISFLDNSIDAISFEAWVFEVNLFHWSDHTMMAYNANGDPVGMSAQGSLQPLYGKDVRNPHISKPDDMLFIISGNEWWLGSVWQRAVVISPLLTFNEPVSKIIFHSDSSYHIGVDDLSVWAHTSSVPEPGTVILLASSLGFLGFFRKRHS
ncbi:MAG: PEP-CTERM sorting domain-containing protein [Desulfobacteraceae bacterium]|nr:MAG: PEP-CTERM sorting domain-containing protein [Desulfobacteraceae bacterium]